MTATPPPPQPTPPPPASYGPPPKKSHTGRNIAFAVIGVFVLLIGGCFAVTASFVNEVDNAIDEEQEKDDAPGGPDNPLPITPGEPFSVLDFDYQPGWTVGADALGDVAIENLKVQNNRDDEDGALVEIRFMQGNEVVALVDCSTEQIPVGQITTLSCFSADDLPAAYDTITISDTF